MRINELFYRQHKSCVDYINMQLKMFNDRMKRLESLNNIICNIDNVKLTEFMIMKDEIRECLSKVTDFEITYKENLSIEENAINLDKYTIIQCEYFIDSEFITSIGYKTSYEVFEQLYENQGD